MTVGIWQIDDDRPKRMRASKVELEQHLEDWIAEDTGLLQAGLAVVGRQIYTAGGPLDLLALDFQGRWIVIEIKRGEVRRETVAQAIDYASCIVEMDADELRTKTDAYLKENPVSNLHSLDEVLEQRGLKLNDEEEREVALMVVGTSQDPGLERMVHFLGERGNLPITVVSFEVFALPSGERVLVRELTESDEEPEVSTQRKAKRRMPTLDEFYQLAESAGTREPIQKFVEGGVRAGLALRIYRGCLALVPPSKKNNTIVVVNLHPIEEGKLIVWVNPSAFTEFLGVEEELAEKALGSGKIEIRRDDIDNFVDQLERLICEAAKTGEKEE